MKYILKKDLPNLHKGLSFVLNGDGKYACGDVSYPKELVENNTDWFQPCAIISAKTIEDKKWTDDDMKRCWYNARREKKNVLGRGTIIDNPISFNRLMDEVLRYDTFDDYLRELESNTTEGKSTKPPLGLKPIWVHHEERLQEIKDAIKRYDDAKKDVPAEWINETQTLQSWIDGRNKEKEESDDKSPFEINKAFEILYTINGEPKSIKYAVTSVTHQNHICTARLVSCLTPKALPNEELTVVVIKFWDDNIK